MQDNRYMIVIGFFIYWCWYNAYYIFWKFVNTIWNLIIAFYISILNYFFELKGNNFDTCWLIYVSNFRSSTLRKAIELFKLFIAVKNNPHHCRTIDIQNLKFKSVQLLFIYCNRAFVERTSITQWIIGL